MEEDKTKLVSIITVCYNSEKTIERTIKSVLGQTYAAIEYIVVDGGSTDGTLNIVNQYEPLFQGRMHIVSESDDGIYDAMNKGIRMSHGELIGIINSDDYYELNAVEIVVKNMKDVPFQVCYGALRILRDGLEESVVIASHHFLKERMIAHPSSFITAAVYREYGCYNTKYKSAADYELMLRLFEIPDVVFVPVYEILANFQEGGFSSTDAGYLDKLRMLYDRGLLEKKRYLLLRAVALVKRLMH